MNDHVYKNDATDNATNNANSTGNGGNYDTTNNGENSDTGGWVLLDHHARAPHVEDFREKLSRLIVAQDAAIEAMAGAYQIYSGQMNQPGKPLGTLLFLGPTGSGKTRVVEAAAEVLFNDRNAMVKIDCAEFQHSHEIAKLIGSPPGYLGHRETSPMLTQENLDRFHTTDVKLTFVLFDEIEKASDALWQLLLGVLDKAILTLGDNRRVDFSRCIVVMTSNLGAREMTDLVVSRIGFVPPARLTDDEADEKIERIATEAARKKFSPEFFNRIDKVVAFRTLTPEAIRRILDLELSLVQDRVMKGKVKFVINFTDAVKTFLLEMGYDNRYGARPLKRAIERYIVMPVSNLIATDQVATADDVLADLDRSGAAPEAYFKRRRRSRQALSYAK